MKQILTFLTFFMFIFSQLSFAQELAEGLYAEMKTNKGTIVLKLFYEKVPNTVANFVGLAEGTREWNDPITKTSKKSKYYDGLTFHRVINDFMIQGGDPLGTGTGGPGYKFADEFHPELRHNKPGILSMANAGPNTNGSQFFITHKETPWLDDKHSVFGEVVTGMEVVNKIEKGDIINNVIILRKGASATAFDTVKIFEKSQAAAKELAEKNKKMVPEVTGKPDPARIPKTNQPTEDEVSVEFLVIGYQGSQLPKQNIYYDQTGALEVAQKITRLARQADTNFSDLVTKYTDLPGQTKVVVKKEAQGLPPFLLPALQLKTGQVSDPVESPLGYIIFNRIELKFVEASHILVSYQGASRSSQKRTKAEALAKAKDLLAQLKSGKDFSELAKIESDGPSKAQGGSLGRFPQGAMVPAFDEAVFALKAGELSDIVETPFGFHIIKRDK